MIDECHSHGLPVIYHGCGNVNRIFEDFIEIGVDAYNPLEYKAGLDAVDLRRRLGHRLGFCGNMDVQLWASGSPDELRAAVLTKLNAAKGGGFIFQSDHSVPTNVPRRELRLRGEARARARQFTRFSSANSICPISADIGCLPEARTGRTKIGLANSDFRNILYRLKTQNQGDKSGAAGNQRVQRRFG